MTLPRNEYPRPQFQRSQWINLNGEWTYEFDFARCGDAKGLSKSRGFANKIIVPFCPESKLSGVRHTEFIEQIWYHRKLEIPDDYAGKNVILHFGGVYHDSVIFLNGEEVFRHVGGSSPFAIDLTGKAEPGKAYDLVVMAHSDVRSGKQPLGKQAPWLKSRGCSYTRTTGIWQTVWMEAVSPQGLANCRIIPNFDDGSFAFMPEFYSVQNGLKFTVEVFDGDKKVADGSCLAGNGNVVVVKLDAPKAWDTADPFLYDIRLTVTEKNGEVMDEVKTYAGLRKIHLENGRYYLNNKPIFLRLVLDQGFYEDGIWTAPTDDALRKDIQLSMKAGFNGARLHQKIFDERFHYWADKLGYLTWGEFPSWGIGFWTELGTGTPEYDYALRNMLTEWADIVCRDFNHPSIITWTPLNETCCYLDLVEHRRFLTDIYKLTRQLDCTRPVNESSGYVHAKTDVWTVHCYDQTVETLRDAVSGVRNDAPVWMKDKAVEACAYTGQPYVVDEYGGISFIPADRRPYAENTWGYNTELLTKEQAEERIVSLTKCLVDNPKVCGYCYTQLTDIEQEQNGIYNYDRTPKFDEEKIRSGFAYKPGWSEL